jgi:hypothetical protein
MNKRIRKKKQKQAAMSAVPFSINDCIKNKIDTGNPVLNSLLRIFYS